VAGDPYWIYRIMFNTAPDLSGDDCHAIVDSSGHLQVDVLTAPVITVTADFVKAGTTPVIYNVTMTNANTEYSQALPSNTKKFSIASQDGTAFRIAFVTGKVATPTAPYKTVQANTEYYEDMINPSSLTLFFACGSAGKVVEIIAWS